MTTLDHASEGEGGATLRLSVIIPARNESATAPLLISRLSQVLADVPCEVIFVDDSDDDTPAVIQHEAAQTGLDVKVVHREGQARRGGLSTAAVEGARAARGRYVCVMDADLQHPPELIISLLSRAEESGADIVIASRNVEGGSGAGLSGPSRRFISWASRWLVKALFPRRLGSITDPLSGFFLARQALLNETFLRPIGFKILLDVLVRCDWSAAEEVPLRFAPRAAGVSKATLSQGRDFLAHTLTLFWHVRFNGQGRGFKRTA